MVVFAGALIAALFAVVIYLATNPSAPTVIDGPFQQVSEDSYVILPGKVICQKPCPPAADMSPDVNLYLRTGSVRIGNVTLTPFPDGSGTVSYAGQVFAAFNNSGMSLGNVVGARPVPGTITLIGMAPESQSASDFATVISTFTMRGGDLDLLQISQIRELIGTAPRTGWRIATSTVTYSFFATPTPQIIVGFPSARYIASNLQSTVVTEDASTTLAAYPCVLGPFSDSFARLSIVTNLAPGTCASSIIERQTTIPLKLDIPRRCVAVAPFTAIVTGDIDLDANPTVCFDQAACSQSSSVVRLYPEDLDQFENTTIPYSTIPLGCSVVGTTQYYVSCVRQAV